MRNLEGVSLLRLGAAIPNDGIARARRLALFVAATGSCLLLAPLARAHGGDPSQIHACIAKDGDVQIVNPSVPCAKNKAPLHWRITGRGSAGPAGLPGPAGPQGLLRPSRRARRARPARSGG